MRYLLCYIKHVMSKRFNHVKIQVSDAREIGPELGFESLD